MASDSHEGLPTFARDVIELFARKLADVRFPGLDLAVLTREAEQVTAAQHEVDRIEAELEEARAAAADRAQALTTVAQRALAYARIFAEDKPTLRAELAEIADSRGPAAGEAPVPKKRARTRKTEGDAGLFTSVDRTLSEGDVQVM